MHHLYRWAQHHRKSMSMRDPNWIIISEPNMLFRVKGIMANVLNVTFLKLWAKDYNLKDLFFSLWVINWCQCSWFYVKYKKIILFFTVCGWFGNAWPNYWQWRSNKYKRPSSEWYVMTRQRFLFLRCLNNAIGSFKSLRFILIQFIHSVIFTGKNVRILSTCIYYRG